MNTPLCINCPVCKTSLDTHDPLNKGHEAPQPGDVTLCTSCSTIFCFGENMQPVFASAEVIAELPEMLRLKLLALADYLTAIRIAKGKNTCITVSTNTTT